MKDDKQRISRDRHREESVHAELRDIWLRFCAKTDDLKNEVIRFESAVRDSK